MATPTIRPDDPNAVQQVSQHRHHRSFAVYSASGVAALRGMLFGYDTYVISGVEFFLKQTFAFNPFIEEVAVSSVLIGAILGAVIGERLSDTLGRINACVV